MAGRSPVVNQDRRTSTNSNWTNLGQEHTSSVQSACQSIITEHPARGFVRWSPFQFQAFLRIKRTSFDKKRKRNGIETHADGDELIENFVLLYVL